MKNHPDTDLAGLHLSDEMLKVLASGKISKRLLCEIATHKDFQRLMFGYGDLRGSDRGHAGA